MKLLRLFPLVLLLVACEASSFQYEIGEPVRVRYDCRLALVSQQLSPGPEPLYSILVGAVEITGVTESSLRPFSEPCYPETH
jgi:hypothetical protein